MQKRNASIIGELDHGEPTFVFCFRGALSIAFNNRLFSADLPLGLGDLISPTTSLFVRIRKDRDVRLAGAQEIQKVQALVVACFANTEKPFTYAGTHLLGERNFSFRAVSGPMTRIDGSHRRKRKSKTPWCFKAR
jgi:hypothetical protein